MKKLYITVLMAALALVSCTNDNDDYGGTVAERAISFARPVMYGGTRVTGEISGVYPTTEKFNVYGAYYPDNAKYPGWASSTVQINGAEFEYFENTKERGWGSATPYYFKGSSKYAFSAYSPSSITTTGITPTNGEPSAETVSCDAKGLNLTNYYTGDMGSQIDLLYTPRIYDITKKDMLHNSATTNDKYDGISLVFKHALSSVHFKAFVDPGFMKKEQGIYGHEAATGEYGIQSITIKNIFGSGNFCQNVNDAGKAEGTPAWTGHSIPVSFSYLNAIKTVNGNPGTDNASVLIKEGDINSDITTLSGDQTRDITQQFTQSDIMMPGQSGIMIPQTFKAEGTGTADSPDAEIVIRWVHNYNAAGIDHHDWYTTRIKLKDHTAAWLPGKRYVYNLVFKSSIIEFKPAVEADWTDENANITI